jgi:hypothetical protein
MLELIKPKYYMIKRGIKNKNYLYEYKYFD